MSPEAGEQILNLPRPLSLHLRSNPGLATRRVGCGYIRQFSLCTQVCQLR